MKRSYSLLIVLLAYINVYAQWNAPYFPTGMTWEEGLLIYDGDNSELIAIDEFEIDGDTIINSLSYKKVICNGTPEKIWIREKDNIVWLHTELSSQDIKLYDFNWNSQQQITTEYYREVDSDHQLCKYVWNTIDISTTILNNTEIQYYCNNAENTIIRGIGEVINLSRSGCVKHHFNCLLGFCMPETVIPGLIYKKVITVKRNGKEIYHSDNANDWITMIPNGIQSILSTYNTSSQIFDLSGRRLNTIPQQGMYIQGGKKWFVK